MKNLIPSEASLLFLFLALFPALALYSQSPQGIPYQAVMRNADGSVMASSAVNLTFMIHDGTANGSVVYQESHALTSNAQGLVSCVVGNGVVSQGNFAQINWGNGAKFLHVMMGTTDLGTQQMLSVPYALYAGSTNLSVSPTGDTLTVGGQSVIVPGISAANPVNNIPTSGLGSQVLPGNATCANEYINVVGCNGQTSLTYDGRTYDLVEIGGQCWFADNLATDQYRNGDPIPTGLDNTTWQNTTAGAYAIYNNDPANDATYGKLYNWFTTADSRGLCPTGWHVPTDCEWMYLEGSLGMSLEQQQLAGLNNRGVSVGGALKAISFWNAPNLGATNSSGFSALPGGYRQYSASGQSFNVLGDFGAWWTSEMNGATTAWYRELYSFYSTSGRSGSQIHLGYSVRCLKDSESSPIQGCTDGAACNFMVNANQDDGTCLYQNATCDDGNANTTNDVINGNCQCEGMLIVSGCTNPMACNFNASANVDNGSCLIQGAACDDGNANTTNEIVTAQCQCLGTYVQVGCTIAEACNYNASAVVDDGTCVFIGASCDDQDPLTINDMIDAMCICMGTALIGEVVINEIDADQPIVDMSEFVELYGTPSMSLTGYSLVLFNGNNDLSYAVYDLDGYSLDSLGFFVLGGVTESDYVVPSGAVGFLQNGPDAVALVLGDSLDWAAGTPVGNAGLVDAVVYGTADANDVQLIASLTPGQTQLDEGNGNNSNSLSRFPDGGAPLTLNLFVARNPTPGSTNVSMFIGCMDTLACNYDPMANVDNGSCLIQGAACNDNNFNSINDLINGSCVCAGTAVSAFTFESGSGVTDIDGNSYTSIIINGQEWMQQNLAVTRYRNGDTIPTGLSDASWQTASIGSYAIYNNDAANNTLYGKLYNWYAVNDNRGLCPTGWHVPSDEEWIALETNLGGSIVAGGLMKSTIVWNSPNNGATNESGFTGLPGGGRYGNLTYLNVGASGYWWSRTANDSYYVWCRQLMNDVPDVLRVRKGKRYGISVRCVRD